MDYKVVDKINISKDCRKIGQFLYDEKNDGLYFDGPWPFKVQIGITHSLTRCEVTPGFLKLPFILRGWINMDILLREIELMELVRSDRLLLHASCVDNDLIVGFPNSGKTYQTFKSVAAGGRLISEEYTVIEAGQACPFRPMTRSCFSKKTLEACGMKLSLNERAHLAFTTARAALMPFMFEAVIWKNIPVSGWKSKVKRIMYGSTGEELKDYKKLIILTENEFPFMANDFLQAYALCSGLDLISTQERQRHLIKEFVHAVYFNSVSQ